MPVQGHYIRALCLIGLAELLEAEGHALEPLLRECGLPGAALQKVDMLIEFRRVQALFELAAHRSGITDLGLRAASCMEPHLPHAGPLLALARFSPNVREWIHDALRYWALHTNAFIPELIEDVAPGVSRVRVHSTVPLVWPRQHAEHMMFTLVALTRHASDCPNETATVIRFQHRAPADTSLHEALFRCPVEFGCEFNENEFRSEVLNYPTGRLLTPLRSVVRYYLQHRISRLEFYDVAVATNVAMAITAMIGSGKSDANSIATALGMHPKQLQRMLAEEGTSYSAVLDEVRATMARDMLAHSGAPIAQVAGLLGYASNPPFSVAFRKWTGLSPLQWRKRHAAAADVPDEDWPDEEKRDEA